MDSDSGSVGSRLSGSESAGLDEEYWDEAVSIQVWHHCRQMKQSAEVGIRVVSAREASHVSSEGVRGRTRINFGKSAGLYNCVVSMCNKPETQNTNTLSR